LSATVITGGSYGKRKQTDHMNNVAWEISIHASTGAIFKLNIYFLLLKTQCCIQKLEFQKLHQFTSQQFHYFDGVYTTVQEIYNHEFDIVLSNKQKARG
jgi:hypothetical protein